jgi:hypothetical protein
MGETKGAKGECEARQIFEQKKEQKKETKTNIEYSSPLFPHSP